MFDGTIEHFSEKPGGIMVDNFIGKVVDAYIITHAHKDHLEGLKALPDVISRSGNNSVIYCTKTTGDLILTYNDYDRKTLRRKFIYKAPGESFTIRHQGDINTRVTFVYANHIPGSVMILFEDDRYKALYTGDMRFEFYERNDVIMDMRRFLRSRETASIDFLYLDVTFLDLLKERSISENKYPSRRILLNELVEFVRHETGYESEYDNVHVDSSSLGWQEVAAYLAWEFDSAVGISDQDYKKQVHKRIMRLLDGNVTFSTPDQSFVHVFSGPDCEYCTDRTLRIKPSVQWLFYADPEPEYDSEPDYEPEFYGEMSYNESDEDTYSEYGQGTGYQFDDRYSWIEETDPEEDPGFYNVLYATHSSDFELHEFVQSVNFNRSGARIFPINRPCGETVEQMSNEEITDEIEKLFRNYIQEYESSPSKRMRRH